LIEQSGNVTALDASKFSAAPSGQNMQGQTPPNVILASQSLSNNMAS
jgi:hypothetical protein